ncbi:MAG TPA: protein translocase subunit SecD [Gammaproteobacteria bacterium]|nr:protein translocase subunit SecD [Gammaproteobacteria bacterium]
MLNRYPLWKNLLLIVLIVLGLIYAAPNMFGYDMAVQISPKNTATIEAGISDQVKHILAAQNIPYISMQQSANNLTIRFNSTDTQFKARDVLKEALDENYIVALNLASRTPGWLVALGGHPMKLGLDLRGGVNFLLDVDTNDLIKTRQEADANNMGTELREKNIRYAGVSRQAGKPVILFRDSDTRDKALSLLTSRYTDYIFTASGEGEQAIIIATLTPAAQVSIINYAVDQNMDILSKRVNELGVSEAVVQRQGANQISVDLPGIQDTTRAKDIVGKTATIRFQLVDTENDLQSAIAGSVPLGSRLYKFQDQPVLLKNQVVLPGSAITYATAMMGENGRPAVSIRLGGGGESLFTKVTQENIHKPLAVVYVETVPQTTMVNGQPVVTQKQTEQVINIATIQSALGNSFEITNLTDIQYAQNLALLLRSGALVASVAIVQERTVGPSLGAENIRKGVISVLVGAAAVIIFMALYYRIFGLVADLALLLNIVFIIALLSLLGATLTLPGIAGIVLTVGISVDANVLIFERIREELRNGVSPQASIHTGYDRAFITIVDANVTTLIVTMILFALGSGVVKSFAITLTIGVLTSMVTAIFFTRAIINWIYGGRSVKSLSIGINVNKPEAVKSLR